MLLTVGAEVDNHRELQNDKSGPDDGTAQSGAAEPLPSMGTGGRTRRGRQNEESGPDGAAFFEHLWGAVPDPRDR